MEVRAAYIAGLIEADGYINNDKTYIKLTSINNELLEVNIINKATTIYIENSYEFETSFITSDMIYEVIKNDLHMNGYEYAKALEDLGAEHIDSYIVEALESINNTAFIAWLEQKLSENKNIVSRLVFSVTAYAVAKDINKFKFFISQMKSLGAKVIIKRYETRFISLNDIKDLNLDYLRLAREYTNDVCIDFSKQSFIESIAEISNLLNIKVLAENVQKDEDFKYIKSLNLFIVLRVISVNTVKTTKQQLKK
jgi:hypothetical protein